MAGEVNPAPRRYVPEPWRTERKRLRRQLARNETLRAEMGEYAAAALELLGLAVDQLSIRTGHDRRYVLSALMEAVRTCRP